MTSLSKQLTCIPTTRTVQIMSAWHSPPPGTRMFLVHRTCPGETTSRQTRESSLPAMRKAQAFAVPTQTPAQCPLHRCLHHLHTRRYSTRLYRRHTPIGQHTTVLFHLPAHCDITALNTLKAGALTKKHRVPDSFASPARMPSSHAFSSHRSRYSVNSMPNDSTVFPSSSAPSSAMPSKSSVKYRYCKPSPVPLASIEPMSRENHIMQQTQGNSRCKYRLMDSPLDMNNQPVLRTPQNDELVSVYQPHAPSWHIRKPDQNVSILQAKGILLNPDRTQDEEELKLMLEFGEQYS